MDFMESAKTAAEISLLNDSRPGRLQGVVSAVKHTRRKEKG
jgi:hypothetical protein